MRALFCVPFPHEQSLPAMDLLQYQDADGNLAGGWWTVGHSPIAPTVLVIVDTTDAMIDEMATNPDYLFLENISDASQIP